MQQIEKQYRVKSTLKGVSGINNVLASQSRSQLKHYENSKSDLYNFPHTKRKEICGSKAAHGCWCFKPANQDLEVKDGTQKVWYAMDGPWSYLI